MSCFCHVLNQDIRKKHHFNYLSGNLQHSEQLAIYQWYWNHVIFNSFVEGISSSFVAMKLSDWYPFHSGWLYVDLVLVSQHTIFWCPSSWTRSVAEHKSNFTMVYGIYIELLTMGFIKDGKNKIELKTILKNTSPHYLYTNKHNGGGTTLYYVMTKRWMVAKSCSPSDEV